VKNRTEGRINKCKGKGKNQREREKERKITNGKNK
jgi:hypothetical protein